MVETLGLSDFEVLDVSTSTTKLDNPQIVMCGSGTSILSIPTKNQTSKMKTNKQTNKPIGKYALTTWKRMAGKTSCADLLMNRASEQRALKKVKHLPGGLFFLTLNSDETLSFWDARRYASFFA